MEHSIALELFNISRVVDDGSFHKLLEPGVARQFRLVHDIPVCCKIILEGQEPPLHIKVSCNDK